MSIWPWSQLNALKADNDRLRKALHRIGEEASIFRGMGGGYAEIDRDPYCIVKELNAAYRAIFPDGWKPPASTERNYLIPEKK
jgi:uncharacterized protein (DUF488 family)